MKKSALGLTLLALSLSSSHVLAKDDKDKSLLNTQTVNDLKFRYIGSTFMSGRIADIAIDPVNPNTWYVGIGSGGIWKTENAGTTWKSIFDGQSVYSIGAVTIDPHNHNRIWVGSGENVGGRHVSFGDGVYLSEDGGKSWKNMGLKKSEHISKIIVHPEDPNTVWVAAQGPLWSDGGERGLFMTTDGGKTWNKTLGDEKWVGVTDLVADPRDPNVMYAATWQRHRTVAAYLGGGEGSGIHKSVDGGKTWQKLAKGLPSSKMGKIGLAISPINPDIVYAAVVLNRRQGAVYRSSDKGASWIKGADAVGGGTGPHYYTELYVSPHNLDEIYLAGVRMQQSFDGGKTFKSMKEEHKHSDNHALSFSATDPNYLLMGSDGGLYESFDKGKNWKFFGNLPVTQFYKIALDDAKPFYNVYGGTQDNNSQVGPSRTDTVQGIVNSDWSVTLFGDGHQPATEPGNPNVFYSQWQQGNLVRVDRSTNSLVYVQPQPAEGEKPERFNWDAPILVSPHDPQRLYFASQRLWQSNDRGDSWTAISGDLTKNLPRIEQPIMGRTQSWDNAWDLFAMSKFSTITQVSESPQKSGLIYVGTDDGLIQITENGGQSWRKIDVSKLPDVPEAAFVNDIKADLHDENTVYITLDNHKVGDYQPYVLKSTNKGKSWKSLAKTLPDNHLVWRIVQDHVQPNLLFLGTEFGVFFTVNGGQKWIKFDSGLPTISFRDLAIHKRENDLVAASFGRGIYVLDDYQALREMSEKQLSQDAVLFPTRDPWLYIEKPRLGFGEKGNSGASFFRADNPEYGATFTYYLKEGVTTLKAKRQKQEKALDKKNKNIPFPGWDSLEAEKAESKAEIVFVIHDSQGNVVKRVNGKAGKGVHRTTWDLRMTSTDAIGSGGGWLSNGPTGDLVVPGQYSATMMLANNGTFSQLAEPLTFNVKRLYKSELNEASDSALLSFRKELAKVSRDASAVGTTLRTTGKRIKQLASAISLAAIVPGSLDNDLRAIKSNFAQLNKQFNGSDARAEVGVLDDHVKINDRLFVAGLGTGMSTNGPTATHKESLRIAKKELVQVKQSLKQLIEVDIKALEQDLENVNAPFVSGQSL